MNKNRRTPLTEWDVLSIEEVARELQIHRFKALGFLQRHNIIRNHFGNSRVLWGDVIKALKEDDLSDEFPDFDISE